MYRKAIASMVDENTIDLDLVDNLKVGDGRLCICYYLDGSNDQFGSITTYSNGGICVDIGDKHYGNIIYKDYLIINGPNPLPRQREIDQIEMPIVSKDYDIERFKRAKQFIKDKGIKVYYFEDVRMDRAEQQNMTYEDYIKKEKSIFDSIRRNRH